MLRPFWRQAGHVLGLFRKYSQAICIILTTADAICAGNSENLSDRALITCIFFLPDFNDMSKEALIITDLNNITDQMIADQLN